MKQGYKTTEFWVTVATKIAVILNTSGLLGSFTLPLETVATLAGLAASYVIGRSVVKLKAE